MKNFSYVVQDQTGKVLKGNIPAENRDLAVAALQEKMFIVLEVRDGKVSFFDKTGQGGGKKVPQYQLAFFAEQLSTLISGGVPLVRSISLLGEYSENPNMGYVLRQIARDISAGLSLHSSLEKHPKVFDHVWLSLVQAGEMGGQLPEVLMQIADYIKRQESIRNKIITAVTYPAILFLMSVGVLIYFIVGIVPVFAQIFKDFDMTLPATTLIVVQVSHVFTAYWYIMLAVLVVLFIAFRLYTKTPQGKRSFHLFLLSLPIFGKFLRHIYYERLLSSMSTLLRSGVTILNAIAVMEESFDSNVVIQNALKRAKKDVSEGKSISDAFRDTEVFPGLMTEMMRMGEESGRLPNIINTLAKFYSDHIDQFIARFSSVIDPILICGVGVIVGFVVFSVFMPIFQMSQIGSSM